MGKLMKFVALMAVLCCLLPTTVTANFWGDWSLIYLCPEGEKADGFQLKTQREQGDGDNTALNGISLKCSGGTWINPQEGPWGTWGGKFLCPSGSWLTTCQLRVQPIQEKGDNTAANNINCKCSNGQTLYGDGLSNGSWQDWLPTCPDGFIEIKTRVAGNQREGDDSALNDVKFFCIEP